MPAVFLSASIPVLGRAGYDTADPYLIREAVSALVEVVLGRKLLVWGGHPAITPMVWAAAESLGLDYGQSVRLFQSQFFEDEFPEDNERFRNVTFTEAVANNRNQSLQSMRRLMLQGYKYDAAVFIGGMEGIIDEFELFRQLNANSRVIAVASPGGTARTLNARVGSLFDSIDVLHSDVIDFASGFYSLLKIRTTDERKNTGLEDEAKR